MKHELREYQKEAVSQTRAHVANGDDVVIVVPTGGGKTTIAADITQRTIARGGRLLWIAHRTELITQARGRLSSFGLDVGVIKSGFKLDLSCETQVASIQTLVARLGDPAIRAWLDGVTVCITDEAHRARARSYVVVRESLPERCAHIGLTATPVRLDGKGLGDMYGQIVQPVSALQLIEDGFLIEPRYFSHTQPDMSGVKRTRGGEYDGRGASAAMRKPQIVGSIVDTYIKNAKGRKAVLFAASVKNSIQLAERLSRAGIQAAHVDGTTDENERTSILESLENGSLDVVCNVDVLTEGWDLPSLEICIDAAPTMSWTKMMQRVGRVMRPEGERPIVFDHAGNLERHGFPTDPVVFDLGDAPLKKKGPAKAKSCPHCFMVVPVGMTNCPGCRRPFPTRERGGPLEVGGEITEVKAAKPTAQMKHEFMEATLEVARKRGYQIAWVIRQFVTEFGIKPRKSKGFDYPLLKARAFKRCEHENVVGGACAFCSQPVDMDEDTRKAIKSRVKRNPSRANVAAVAREFGITVSAAYGIANR
jgi:superfamily II DNA or RNA helicase